MTVVLTLEDSRARLDQAITLESLRDLIVIVRDPAASVSATPAQRATAWAFDDDHLITWEDAEWQ